MSSTMPSRPEPDTDPEPDEHPRSATRHSADHHTGALLGSDPLLGRVVARLRALTGADAGWVVRVDEAAGSWAVEAGDGPGLPPADVVAEVVATRQSAVVPAGPGGRSVLAVPVRRGPRLVGVCVVAAAAPRRTYTAADRGLAELVADYAALALADHGALAGRGLMEGLRQELAWTEGTGVRADLVAVGQPALDGRVADEVFRVVQEALANVVAHARARRVQVGVVPGPGTLTVLVEDDGRGFDVAAHGGLHEAASGTRRGLAAMTARARRLDGELEIESAPGDGTVLRLTVPCGAEPASPGRTRPSVLVAAARPVVRAGVVRLLQLGAPDLGMVSEVDGSEDLAATCRLLDPDVLVVEPDVLSPDGDLAVALGRVADLPAPPAVVLLASSCPDHRLRTAVAAGVKGCVGPDDGGRLAAVVTAAGRGETSFAPDQLGVLAAAPERHRGVTAREQEVRGLVAQGFTDRQIASALSISAKTVEKHVGSLLRKTGARNRTMLVHLGGR
ncbi:response regulator transcription factor family protein [Actinomycetospora sp. TBRC 11914]|uniref:helix-turn-helix transcriptional regulator n=1 Tax=Actinomycetospora sp. TBRC 11914 TaxID=2729387 RepID=UPI00145D228A|nr:response regulator transcription factor family protein [Actinomycetospora sp. TBRC 11914]NMO89201.1 GAF domain-containing protein [Actinomycetospora sp. TBRC 11914]